VGYVLLDRDARAAGHLSQGDWQGAPVLPVALDATEPVAFSSSAGRTVFDLRPGVLAHVHGAAGAVEWLRVRNDVSDERLQVYGPHDAAADLAHRLAGRLEGGKDGLFTVSAPDILDRGSFLQPPDGIVEVVPEPVVEATGLGKAGIEGRSLLGAGAADQLAVPAPGGEGAGLAALVGVYASGGSALILDAAGGFEMADLCSGDETSRGRYHTDGDRIVLDAETPMVLAIEDGALRDAAGGRFAPVAPPTDPPPRAAETEEGDP
jgi:hypothetical protein